MHQLGTFLEKYVKDTKEAGIRLNMPPFFSRITVNLHTRMQKIACIENNGIHWLRQERRRTRAQPHTKAHLRTRGKGPRAASNYCIHAPCIPYYVCRLSSASCQITLYQSQTKGIGNQFTRLIVRGGNRAHPLIHKKKKSTSLSHVSTSNISLEINRDQLF